MLVFTLGLTVLSVLLLAFLCFAGFATSLALAIVLDDRSARGVTQVHDAIFRDRWAALAQVLVATATSVPVYLFLVWFMKVNEAEFVFSTLKKRFSRA